MTATGELLFKEWWALFDLFFVDNGEIHGYVEIPTLVKVIVHDDLCLLLFQKLHSDPLEII